MGWELGPDLGVIGASQLVDMATWTLNRFRELRIPVPQDSRLERARSIVGAASSGHALNSPQLAEAIRTVLEMRWIARALRDAPPRPQRLTNAVATMLSGPDIEEAANGRTKPRSLQFELYIAALLTAGRVPVKYEEPDLLIHYLGEWVGIAVKRPRSRRRIAKLIDKAADQIERRASRGMVAINVDGLLDEAAADGAAWEKTAGIVDQLPEIRDGIRTLLKRPRVRGLLALGTPLRWRTADGRPQLESSTFMKWNFLGLSDSEEKASGAFEQAFRIAFAQNASY